MPVAEHKTHTRTRSERLEARVTRETKALCERAAQIEGSTLTEFVVSSSLEAAKRTLRAYEHAELTQRDRMAFVEALLTAAPAPNARLQRAAARHAQLFGE